MDQDGTPPPPPQPRTSSNTAAATRGRPPFAASSSTPSPVRGPTSSAMLLGMPSPAHSHRRFSPSLYPPPTPPMSGRRLASGSGSSSSLSPSPSRSRQEIPPPSPKAARGGRQRNSTHSLHSHSSVLSELASIRSVAAARATSQKLSEMRAVTLYGGGPLQQALPSWSAMYARSRLGTPPPSGSAPPVSRQRLQPSTPPPTGTLPAQPSRRSSFPGFVTSASQQAQPSSSGVHQQAQQQQAKSSFTDLAPLPGGSGIFSEFAPPASSQQAEAVSSFSDLAFHGGQPLTQALPSLGARASQQLQQSSSAGVPILPGGTYSGFPSPAMRQPQANSSFTDPPPLPGGAGIFSDLSSGSGIAAPAASQQLQTKSSFTTLAPLPSGSGIAPAASQQQLQAKSCFTTLAPLPGGSLSGITPRHGEAAMFGSSSWSSSAQLAAPASNSDTMSGQGQPASDSELHPLPPSLEIRSDEVMQFSQPSGNDNTFSEPKAAATLHTPQVFQVKAEPVDIDTPCLQLQPELISVDDEEDEISALLRSFQSPNEPGSLYLEHTSTQDMLQIGGGGGPSGLGVVEGSGQSWKGMVTVTPYNKVTTGASIPWNCSDGSISMPQQQIPQEQGDVVFSTGFSDAAVQYCQPSGNNIMSGFGQQLQPDLQMPTMMLSATELLQLISRPGPSIWSTADSSGQQGVAAMPSASSASMFDQVDIGGGTMNTGQGWPESVTAVAGQYGVFDNSGSSSSAWTAVPDQMTSKLDQMSISQGWPATPSPMFDITGSSSAWASMPWNTSSWAMENCSTPGPNLRLGAMEQPRLTTPRPPPSIAAGANRGMSQRGAHGDIFSAAEIETIVKDKRLKEMVNADPKRVKRILNNRTSVAKLRPQRRAE